MIYFLFATLTIISQFGVGITAFFYGRYKEGIVGILFGIANGIIYLWRT